MKAFLLLSILFVGCTNDTQETKNKVTMISYLETCTRVWSKNIKECAESAKLLFNPTICSDTLSDSGVVIVNREIGENK